MRNFDFFLEILRRFLQQTFRRRYGILGIYQFGRAFCYKGGTAGTSTEAET